MSYMIFVEGKSAPTKEHDFLVDAEAEAERLAEQPDNKMRKIYILKVVEINKPIVNRVWVKSL